MVAIFFAEYELGQHVVLIINVINTILVLSRRLIPTFSQLPISPSFSLPPATPPPTPLNSPALLSTPSVFFSLPPSVATNSDDSRQDSRLHPAPLYPVIFISESMKIRSRDRHWNCRLMICAIAKKKKKKLCQNVTRFRDYHKITNSTRDYPM